MNKTYKYNSIEEIDKEIIIRFHGSIESAIEFFQLQRDNLRDDLIKFDSLNDARIFSKEVWEISVNSKTLNKIKDQFKEDFRSFIVNRITDTEKFIIDLKYIVSNNL